MNKERRSKIDDILSRLSAIEEEISELEGEEQDYFDNMPEGLQDGEKGDKAQAAIEALQDANSAVDEVKKALERAEE